MPRIPRDQSFDSTLALLFDPYGFVSKRCRRYGADLFQARLLLRPTICMSGPEAAELFYRRDLFVRRGATPGRIQKTLFGRGGVQGLDGDAHRHRKQMFMSLMTPERIDNLKELTAGSWSVYAQSWAAKDRVVLYDEVQQLLTRVVCAWAGVPLPEPEAAVARRSSPRCSITRDRSVRGTGGPACPVSGLKGGSRTSSGAFVPAVWTHRKTARRV